MIQHQIEAEKRYKRHLAEFEEIHRKRLERNSEKPDLLSNEGECKIQLVDQMNHKLKIGVDQMNHA